MNAESRFFSWSLICILSTFLFLMTIASLRFHRVRAAAKNRRDKAESNAGHMQSAAFKAAAHLGSWEFDPATKRATYSDEMFRLFYLDPGLGAPAFSEFLERVHPEDRSSVIEAFAQTDATIVRQDFEYRTHPSIGPIRYLNGTIDIIRDGAGARLRSSGTVLDITERKLVEATLRQSEARFFTAFEQAPIGIALVSPDGGFLKVNRVLCELLGYREAELLAHTFRTLTHPDDLADSNAAMRNLTAGKINTFQIEKRYIHARGHIVTALLNVSLVRNRRVRYHIAYIQDITERKYGEAAIKRAVQRLSEAQCIGKIGDWEFEITTQLITWSSQVFEILGRDPRLGAPQSHDENAAIFDAISGARMVEKIMLAIDSGDTQQYELLAFRPDGERVWVQLVATPHFDGSGQISGLHGTVQDITARKRNEMVAARMAAIIESSEDAIISKDINGFITDWNSSAERIFGYKAAQIVGRSILQLIPADHHDEEKVIMDRIKRGERIEHFETVRLGMDGSMIDVSVTVSPVKDILGTIVGASKVLRDISERRRINDTFRRYAERLQRLSRRLMETEEEERRRLGRDLHDQTGSNLTAMALSLQILRGKLPPEISVKTGPWLDDIEILLKETMVHIRDVLSDLRPPALDELGLLAALRHYVHRVAGRSNLQVEIEGREPSPRLSPDIEIAFFRIAQEALTNVLKHAEANRVFIGLHSDDECVVLHIKDNGKGFDAALQIGGSNGLGMATMQERAEAIKASFTLISALNSGTEITIQLSTPPHLLTSNVRYQAHL